MAICYEVERVVPSRSSPERLRVARVVKELRQRVGISQEEMAPRVGLTLAGYRPYEQGKRELSMEQIPVFAEALEVSRAELATRLGLGPGSVRSVHAAEVSELLERVTDPAVAEEMMAAIRAVARVAELRARPPESDT